MKIIVGVGLAMALWILGYHLHFLPVPKPQIYQYITLTLIAIVQPTVIYLTVRRNYESSNHLAERLEIEVTIREIKVQGESFYLVLAWDKIFKVEEESNHFLIYQNNLSAIVISKKDLHKSAMEELKQIFKSIPLIPIHLTKSS